jgi:hypothetical protein
MQRKLMVLTVSDIVTEFDNPKAPLAKLLVDINDNLRMEVPIWGNNFGDKYGTYPPYAILPFQYTYDSKYTKGKEEKTTKRVAYHMDIRPQGEENTLESNNLWENIRVALVSGYLRIVGDYDTYFQRHTNRLKDNDNFTYRGCDNCRFHEIRQTDESNNNVKQNDYEHFCALTEERIDENDENVEDDREETKEDKRNDLRIKTYSQERIRENKLRDAAQGCPYHRFFSNFSGGKGDFFAEITTPILPMQEEDKEFFLPYGIVIDFVPAFLKYDADQKETDQISEEEISITKELMELREGLDEEKAKKIAMFHASSNNYSKEQTERFIDAFVALRV